jgi:hypothetical protein
MLADAVDGMLPTEEQQFFDAHVGDCGPCVQLLAEARRGAAWLEMLRTPAPEPPPALLEKILAQTSGSALLAMPVNPPMPAMAPGYTNVLPFPRRVRSSRFARIVFEPRLAMTAAMAFFSIALTLDLMGVNPLSLRAGDFTPSGIERAFSELDARAVQYYEGLRVVYELESRVHDYENVQDNARDAAQPAQNQNAPAAQTPDQQAQPSGDDQSAPDQNDAAPQAAPAPQQQPQPSGKSSLEPSMPWNMRVGRRDEGHEHVERRAA